MEDHEPRAQTNISSIHIIDMVQGERDIQVCCCCCCVVVVSPPGWVGPKQSLMRSTVGVISGEQNCLLLCVMVCVFVCVLCVRVKRVHEKCVVLGVVELFAMHLLCIYTL